LNLVELIRKKREGRISIRRRISLSNERLCQRRCSGLPDVRIPDGMLFPGMSREETLTFTRLMLHSGQVIDLSEIPGVKVDKHSTGGVGDKVSLILAPMVAACGVPVPMIPAAVLGTLAVHSINLESIPGFRTDLTISEYKHVIHDVGS